ncbi:hypothetical protein PHYBLDRAFT_146969 [Phycomyces blakesleeanus NRRL 1555(-)]|uniref:Uncharacterized protein n=1 Tax=Phycomyces blakesleeanus (strain ATCC 8743b / DSM 1359 / FGSC 10004 / NBRC 33097 / NRRL 1555) TaxID=763407 RepID=A0A162N846_PHYB8|nr:hypothetical protein PHYBLDRAFT_146969 [Phycomyces blakesleeanus NRRL 1555(-)]OAD71988.1 hypothetical protein PHYBLDRAFT_146969 [Phycomyces blakesleeanus NRRL 1555(-)]|eukprot:XP_018290028.1 hypothetical protein PHYBLDRAFT_146969 [Phycomyces blakesleeanus NRRL 1555(-)]
MTNCRTNLPSRLTFWYQTPQHRQKPDMPTTHVTKLTLDVFGYWEQDFPRNLGGPLLSIETCHLVDSPLTSTPTSLVPPATAHCQTKPLKESTVWYPLPKTH